MRLDELLRENRSVVHDNTKLLFENMQGSTFSRRPGCWRGPDNPPSTLRQIIGEKSIRWETVGIDQNPLVSYTAASEYSYPIDPEVADIVVATNVMEHVREPWVWIKELAIICKSGRYVITINPVSWPDHEYPVDCWGSYAERIKARYEDAGLEVINSRCESLEDAHLRKDILGRSLAYIYGLEGWTTRTVAKMMQLMRWPAERPYDTVTIGRK